MLALAGLVTLSVSLIALLPPYLAKLVFDRGVAAGDIGTIVLYGLLAIGAYLLSSVLDFAGDALSSVAGTRFTVNVKSQAVQRLLQMRLEFFDKHQSGYLAERLSEVQMLGQFVSPTIFQFLGNLIQFIGALVIMARISVEITIVPLLFVVPFYFITRKMSRSLKETSEELMETGAQMMGSLQEMIGGVAEVKQSTAEERKSHEAAAQFAAFGSQEIKQSIFMGLGMGSIDFLTNLVMVIVLILSGIFIVRGELSMGDYIALAGYVGRLFTPVQMFGMFILTIQPAMAALERLRPIFEEKTEREVGGKNRV
ncbi:ABC transporter ATP-binding protein, partial [Dehalococcoidia bacterium]|nr:ABC transporter ATP-binding protein [Dehalococcoidia bacterium]